MIQQVSGAWGKAPASLLGQGFLGDNPCPTAPWDRARQPRNCRVAPNPQGGLCPQNPPQPPLPCPRFELPVRWHSPDPAGSHHRAQIHSSPRCLPTSHSSNFCLQGMSSELQPGSGTDRSTWSTQGRVASTHCPPRTRTPARYFGIFSLLLEQASCVPGCQEPGRCQQHAPARKWVANMSLWHRSGLWHSLGPLLLSPLGSSSSLLPPKGTSQHGAGPAP